MIFCLLQHKNVTNSPQEVIIYKLYLRINLSSLASYNIILHLVKKNSLYTQSTHATHITVNMEVKVQFQHYFSLHYFMSNCITDLERDNQSLRSEIAMLKCTKATITPEVYINNSELLKFYTGLPNWTIVDA